MSSEDFWDVSRFLTGRQKSLSSWLHWAVQKLNPRCTCAQTWAAIPTNIAQMSVLMLWWVKKQELHNVGQVFSKKILCRKMQACAMHLTLNVFQFSPTCHVVRSSAALCLWQLEEQEKMQGKPQRFCFTWPWCCFNQIQAPQLSIWWTGWNVILYKSAKIMDLKIGPGSATSLMAEPSSHKPRLCNVWKQSI